MFAAKNLFKDGDIYVCRQTPIQVKFGGTEQLSGCRQTPNLAAQSSSQRGQRAEKRRGRRIRTCPRHYTTQSPGVNMNCRTKAKIAAAIVAMLVFCLAIYGAYSYFSSGNTTSSRQEQSTAVTGNDNQTHSYTGSLVIGGSILGAVLVAIIGAIGYLQQKSNNATLLAERRLDVNTVYLPSAPLQSQPPPYNSNCNQPMPLQHSQQLPQIQHVPATQFQPHSSSHTVHLTELIEK